MDIQLLEDIGLTNTQAIVYQALVQNGGGTAPLVAKLANESRSNTYKILDRLCEIGLATKDESGAKVHYFPTSPVALEQLLQKQSAAVELRERKLRAAMPTLLDFYSKQTERPSIRYYQGVSGLRAMYVDQTKSKTPVYFIRSDRGMRMFGPGEAHRLRNLFPANTITRYGIIQDIEAPDITPEDRMPVAESDKIMMLNRTWITTDDYNEPVEWVSYDNKLSIISFGKEIIGVTIESTQIARAFQKIYTLLSTTLQERPNYKDLPRYGKYTRIPTSTQLRKKFKKEPYA